MAPGGSEVILMRVAQPLIITEVANRTAKKLVFFIFLPFLWADISVALVQQRCHNERPGWQFLLLNLNRDQQPHPAPCRCPEGRQPKAEPGHDEQAAEAALGLDVENADNCLPISLEPHAGQAGVGSESVLAKCSNDFLHDWHEYS